MDFLNITLNTVTPVFIGGADPNLFSEFRPPSVKGILRFWYRTVDSRYQINEERWFGSTKFGQSPCVITLEEPVIGKDFWDTRRYNLPEPLGACPSNSLRQA